MTDVLFIPVKLGAIELDHRVIMAPLTRLRADVDSDNPNDLMREYYAQRASMGGLIISEATTVSPTARGYRGSPGLYTEAHVRGWQQIVDAVHAGGGKMVAQLWHVGRTSHASLIGGEPVTASDVPYEGMAFTADGWVPASRARSISIEEIAGVVADYAAAARRAMHAGFDGVEIHAASGYLIDQFLQDNSNVRTDAYGGSVVGRARLLMEIVDAVANIWGAGKVAVRLSPSSNFNGMADSDPDSTFTQVAAMLDRKRLAYLHVVEPRISGFQEVAPGLQPVAAAKLCRWFGGAIVAAGGFDGSEAAAEILRGGADAIAFGRYFISNPDLPGRLRSGCALTPYDRSSFYAGGSRGYTDYSAAVALVRSEYP